MLRSYPSAWLLLGLPFLSSLVLRSVPPLFKLASRLNRLTLPIGIAGLAILFACLTGVVPPPYALPLAFISGVVSGYAVFSLRPPEGNDDDWRRGDEPPDEPPQPPGARGPLDWQLFDRLRAEWEQNSLTRG